jgi:hypothetical protein
VDRNDSARPASSGSGTPQTPDDVRDQLSVRPGAVCRGHGLRHVRVRDHRRLDLTQLDPVPAHLHLPVQPAEVLQRPGRQPPYGVSGPVHPGAGRAERVGNEPFRGEPGPAGVPEGHPATPDVQLASDMDRNQLQPVVQYVRPRVGDRAAHRHGAVLRRIDPVDCRVDGRLGRSVAVPDGVGVRREPAGQGPGQRLTAAQRPPTGDRPATLQQHEPGRRSRLQEGDSAVPDGLRQQRTVADGLAGQHGDRCADGERGEEFDERDVERDRHRGPDDVARGHLHPRGHVGHEVADRLVVHDDGLRPSG